MEGVVNLLKPPGITSSDAVSALRRIFQMKRVGHTGTLDPMAAGVLPICLGRATRLFDYFVDKDKEYIAELSLGVATDTQDACGRAIVSAATAVTPEALCAVLPRFLGEQRQIAPMYSAVRVNGKRLYALARRGAEAVEKPRLVTIQSIDYLEQTGPQAFLLKIVCSRGTYIRTLLQDIGAALGAPAHLCFLLRTRSGAFGLETAYTLEELEALKEQGALARAVIPPEAALAHLGEIRLRLDERQARLLQNGAAIA
jgi:tRNA pseudouridine55 synthase